MRHLVSSPGMLNAPRAIRVRVDSRGRPVAVDGVQVKEVTRGWLNGFGWWWEKPLRRRYYEVLTVSGGRVVLFRDTFTDRWYSQGG